MVASKSWQRLFALISTVTHFLAEFTGNKTFFLSFFFFFCELLTVNARQYIILGILINVMSIAHQGLVVSR
jgi:hypothetical protein